MNNSQKSYLNLTVFILSCDSQVGPRSQFEWELMKAISYEIYDGESWMTSMVDEAIERINLN